ncbi:MAG: hypothetical protein M1608_09675 [Candidatus Omnitrophica bacterium]|nr:hypothetical protein [Candidatus Omnitrophota bacterium]
MSVHIRTSFMAALVLLAGCSTGVMPRTALVSPFRPANVYCREACLPSNLRRVAVLPLTGNTVHYAIAGGIETLEPILNEELRKQNAFELVFVSREQLQILTGLTAVDTDRPLPAGFFKKLARAEGCDGVIIPQLTVYRPYPPLAVGWNIKLVECQASTIWWSVDEVFDAGSLPVAAAAESYSRAELNLPDPLLADSSVLSSPRRFGQYSAYAVVATLPVRINTAKGVL